MLKQRGDDLDDDFVPDDLVALSDAAASDPGDDVHDLLSADEGAEDDGRDDKTKFDREKKRKRREKEKQRKAKVPTRKRNSS
jgi:protein CMS1